MGDRDQRRGLAAARAGRSCRDRRDEGGGVPLYSGGLDNDAPVFHVEQNGGGPDCTGGPHAETKEIFGSFAAVNVPDEASARYWAGKLALACNWPQQVRIFGTPAQIATPDADRAAAAATATEACDTAVPALRARCELRLRPAAGKFGSYSSRKEAKSPLAATGVYNEKLVADGHFVFAGALRSASTATGA